MKPSTVGVVIVAGFFALLGVRPASAQVDLSGMWAPIFHEDQIERVPGPEMGALGYPEFELKARSLGA